MAFDLADMKQQHLEYLARWKANGKPTARYQCPSCRKIIETTRPSNRDESWTSGCICAECGGLHHYTVRSKGRVKARALFPGPQEGDQ